jgi:predicted ester cyclase
MTPAQLARRYYRFFNQRRLDEAGELVDVQAVFHYVPTNQRLVGRAGYRALAAMWLVAFEDAEVDVQSIEYLDEHTVHVTFIGRGTHTGDLELGDKLVIPATGRHTELVFRDTLEIRNDRITRVEFDFDLMELQRRLLPDGAVAVPLAQNDASSGVADGDRK